MQYGAVRSSPQTDKEQDTLAQRQEEKRRRNFQEAEDVWRKQKMSGQSSSVEQKALGVSEQSALARGEAAAPEPEPAASKRSKAGGKCEDCEKVTANYALVAGGKKRWCGGCGVKHGAVMARHPHSPAQGGSPRPAAAESKAEKPKAESEVAKRRRKQEPAKATRGVGGGKVDARSAPPPQAGKSMSKAQPRGQKWVDPRGRKPATQGKLCMDCGVRRGVGRIVISETGSPNLCTNLLQSGRAAVRSSNASEGR